MALPKLEHPKFDLTIPSTKAKISFRPYTVKEQKILLMLKESTETEELITNLKDLIASCCIGTINIEKLTYFDIEYIFLKMRSRSVGETSTVTFKCNNTLRENVCGAISEIEVDLNSVEVDFSDSENQDISIENNIIIRLSYPGIRSVKLLEEYDNTRNIDSLIKAICLDIESIKDDETIYDDYSKQELEEFISNLSIDSFESILKFYISAPKLKKKIEFNCKKCGHKDNIMLSGLSDFFD